jgi:CBS domain containing-hemolysin-like protein
MVIALLLGCGIALSAFFSGSETGFYRVTRVRLVMDAKSGRWISRILLWLTNHASVVVATVLIGNNIANYLVSLGILLLSQYWFAQSNEMQTILPLLATPLLFIYGELLPKYLFYQAPYKLLNLGAPLLVVCAILFLPVSFIVIAMERVWQRLLKTNSIKSGSRLERQVLQRVLIEGQEAGVLLPIQREIAQNMFTYGVRPVRQFTIPLRAIPTVDQSASSAEILDLAGRRGRPYVGLLDASGQSIVACYLTADLLINPDRLQAHPVHAVLATESNLQVLAKLQVQLSPLAVVQDAKGRMVGIVEKERLNALLLVAG